MEIDWKVILYQAIVVVGLTELFKKFIKTDKSWIKVLVTVGVWALVTVLLHFFDWLLVPLLVLSLATVCYDTIFVTLKALAGELSGDEYGGAILLGLKAPVVKGHGSTSATAFKYGVLACAAAVRGGLCEKIADGCTVA